MSRLPRISGKYLIKALSRAGFQLIRIKGSHHFIRHDDGRATVVPLHRNEEIGPGLLTKILKDCDLSAEQFRALL